MKSMIQADDWEKLVAPPAIAKIWRHHFLMPSYKYIQKYVPEGSLRFDQASLVGVDNRDSNTELVIGAYEAL